MMTAGPYRPIHLITYTTHIVDLHPRAVVSANLSSNLFVEINARGNTAAVESVRVVLRNPAGEVIKKADGLKIKITPDSDTGLINWQFGKDDINLWWPTAYGKQELYEVEVVLLGQVRYS